MNNYAIKLCNILHRYKFIIKINLKFWEKYNKFAKI